MTIKALASARERNSDFIEGKVRSAVDAVVAEGRTPSFYNVSSRAQVARSTLYRNPRLRSLVEFAREDSAKRGCQGASPIERLRSENEKLHEEVRMLEAKLHLTKSAQHATSSAQRSDYEYAVIAFPKAA